MDEIKIIEAIPEDAEDILNYCNIIGSETDNLSYGAEGIQQTIETETEYLEKVSESDRQIILLAKKGDMIVGIADYVGHTKPRMAHRGSIGLSVLKSMWGQHIGTLLMQELVDFAKNKVKAEIISLEVRSDNDRAIGLYKKFGFEKIGHFPGFFKINGEDIGFDLMNLYL